MVILLDLIIRATDLQAFYSNDGVLPVEALNQFIAHDFSFSIHSLSGSVAWQICLFGISALCAMALLLGYQTRLFTALSWFLLLSLQNRNPLILQGGDDLLRMLLFWGFFMPWGERYTINPAQHKSENTYTGIAGLAYLLQVAYVYGISALEKGPEWNSDFSAMYYVYQLDQITYPLGKILATHEQWLKIQTALAYYFELLVPVFLFIPGKNGRIRLAGIISIIGFHVWNGATLQIGLFFIIGIISTFGLLPASMFRNTEKNQNIPETVHLTHSEKMIYTLRQGIVAIFTLYVLGINLGNLPFTKKQMASWLKEPGHALGLNQDWNMFAPSVLKNDGWYLLEGITPNGDTTDLLTQGEKPNRVKPASVVATYKNDRWRKFGEFYANDAYRNIRPYYCRYVLNRWNKEHPEKKIRQVSIVFMHEPTLPDYLPVTPVPVYLSTCY